MNAAPELATRSGGSLLKKLMRRPLPAASIIYLVLLTVVIFAGRALAPYDPNETSFDLLLAPASPAHLLGGDSSGRDVLSRLLVATQTSIAAALVAVVTAMVIGVTAGLIAGYFKGWIDGVFSWVTSLMMALPAIVVLLASRSILGPSVWVAMVVLGVLISATYFRLVYGTTVAVRKDLFIDAARVSGLTDGRIIARHVLPVVRAPIIVLSADIAGLSIAVQSGLEFLGLGDRDVPTWGSMLNEAFVEIYSNPLLMLWPALAIGLTCVTLTLLSNAMRDELELAVRPPRIRRRQRVAAAAAAAAAAAGPGRETESAESTIVHPDDRHTARFDSAPLLRVKGLRVAYRQADGSDVEVVHGVSFDVRPGEIHGLIGESGSGKSQTAFSVLGQLPRGGRVTAGTVYFEGSELIGSSAATRLKMLGRSFGYIPQEPMSNLDPSFTIGSQLVEPLRVVCGMSKADAKTRALELLARVGIADPVRTFDSYPFEISGGMAQRVLIAGAVSTNPSLIVADEPTTALDVTLQADVLELLRELQEERGMGMLLVTHNVGVVADLCDSVSVMQSGRLVEQGPVRAILETPAHPYTRELLGSILDGGPARTPMAAGRSGAGSPNAADTNAADTNAADTKAGPPNVGTPNAGTPNAGSPTAGPTNVRSEGALT